MRYGNSKSAICATRDAARPGPPDAAIVTWSDGAIRPLAASARSCAAAPGESWLDPGAKRTPTCDDALSSTRLCGASFSVYSAAPGLQAATIGKRAAAI